jgi:hypothetical protein
MAGMHPVLEQTRAVLARPLAGCSPEQVARHPGNDPASWSAWQVIDHLAATWRGTIRGLEDRLQKGRPLQSRPNLQQRLGQLAVCYLGYFPNRRQAPEPVRPSSAPAEPVSAPILTHFALGPLSVSGWRRFHRAHARHHAPQIERALRDP